ncbi:MAG: BatA domain-containing protein [Planctomycetota bacterium]|nr:BatA domain-containing protein [Planctomycetota bacterium]
MGFQTPLGFLALGGLLLLFFISFWKRRPTEMVVGSLRLWKAIPERATSLETARRPRFSLSLLLQALAIVLLTSALASPFLRTLLPAKREITVVVDTSARLQARGDRGGTRFEEGMRSLLREASRLTERDSVTLLWDEGGVHSVTVTGAELPSVLKGISPIESRVNLDLLLSARDLESELWLLSDRRPADKEALFFPATGPVSNTGIDLLSLDNGELFVRLIRTGGASDLTLEILVEGVSSRTIPLRVKEGRNSWQGSLEVSESHLVEVRILEEDSFPLDNRAWLNRGLVDSGVRYFGREHALLLRVLQSIPGVVLGGDGYTVVYREARPFSNPAIYVDPPEAPKGFQFGSEFSPKRWHSDDHPLLENVRMEEMGASSAKGVTGGVPFLFADGVCVGAVLGRTIVLGFDLPSSGWCTTPSFPIFWTNVFEFVRTSNVWNTIRAGVPIRGENVVFQEVGERTFRGQTVGVSLLDSHESDLRRAPTLVPSESSSGDMSAGQKPLSVYASVIALCLIILSWWSDRSGR